MHASSLRDALLLALDAKDGADRFSALFGGFGNGGVFKKRVALPGRGKSGSVRTLVATNRGSRWFFVFGFEKNERANVSTKDIEAVQRIAADLFRLSPSELDAHVTSDALKEICHDSEA